MGRDEVEVRLLGEKGRPQSLELADDMLLGHVHGECNLGGGAKGVWMGVWGWWWWLESGCEEVVMD